MTSRFCASAKKWVALLTSIALFLLTCASMSLPALADDGVDAPDVTRGEWLHRLVETFDITVADENYPEEYFSDVTEESQYYVDYIKVVEFGIVDVPAGGQLLPDEPATREFVAHTLNFCLGFQPEEKAYSYEDSVECQYPDDDQIALDRGWFGAVDGAFMPSKSITQDECEWALSDARAVWMSVQMDGEHENEIAVKPGVVLIPEGTEVSQIDESTIAIVDSPVALSAGDDFVVVLSGVPCAFTATFVSSDGSSLIVTSRSTSFDEVVESVNYQSEAPFALTSMERSASSGMSAQSVDDFKPSISIKTSWTDDSVSASGTITMQGTDETGYTDQTAKNEASITASLSNLKQQTCVSDESAFFIITGDMNVSASASGSMGFSLPLYTTPTYPIDFSIDLDLSCSGSASAKSTSGFRVGFQVMRSGSIRTVKEFTKKHFEQTIDAKMSLELKASVNYEGAVFKGSVYAKLGVGADVKLTHYDEGLPTSCTSVAIYLKASAGVTGSYSLGPFKGSASYSHAFWDVGNSPVKLSKHIEDGVRVEKCTRGSSDYISELESKAAQYYETSTSSSGSFSTPTWDYRPTSSKTATIVKYKGGSPYVEVPRYIKDYEITGVSYSAFTNTPAVSLRMPSSVKSLSGGIFDGVERVVLCADSVTIDSGLTLVGCSVEALGSLSCGYVRILGNSSMIVRGNASLGLDEVSGDGNAITVYGDFRSPIKYGVKGVTAGTFTFYGDVNVGNSLGGYSNSDVVVVLCGSGPQTVYAGGYYAPLSFGYLRKENPDAVFANEFRATLACDAFFDGDLKANLIKTNGYDLTITGNADIMSFSVSGGSEVNIGGNLEGARSHQSGYSTTTTTCENSTISIAGSITSTSSGGSLALLSGSKLYVSGVNGLNRLTVSDSDFVNYGAHNEGGGDIGAIVMTGLSRVNISGDTNVSQIAMRDSDCIMHIAGSLKASSGFFYSTSNKMDKGVLELEGDLTVGHDYSYCGGVEHMTVLCGSGPQSISFNPYCNYIKNLVNTHADPSEVTGIPSGTKCVQDTEYKTGASYVKVNRF